MSSASAAPVAGAAASASAASSEAPPTEAAPKGESSGVQRVAVDVAKGEELGYAVASHGEEFVVSAYKRKNEQGSLFVFKVEAGKPTLEVELEATGSKKLGNALAFDGTQILAGALYDDGRTPETGASYVFLRGEKGFGKAEKLSAVDAKRDDSFGIGLAIAGSTLIVGNSRESGGSLYTFERGKAAIGAKATLVFPKPNGPAEAIAGSGDWVFVGSELSGKLEEQGSVQVYRRGKTGFVLEPELSEKDAAESQHFGGSVAVLGSTLAVTSDKQVTVFTLTDGKWQESARFTPPIATGLGGAALAVSEDRIAIGFHLIEAGRVLVYRRQGSEWKLEKTVSAPDGKNEDWFGYSLALSPGRLVVGAPLAAERTGAVYVTNL
ncbi:MAG: hypothetical protein U0263_30670 [Polyangiaceae bacterium]